MQPSQLRSRLLTWLPAAIVGAGLVGALALQHLLGWVPCPLCIIQRLTAILLFVSLWAYAYGGTGTATRTLAKMSALLASSGGIFAGIAHLHILFNPETTSCGPGLSRIVARLVDAIPGSEWLLEGAGLCENATYTILGAPLALWSIFLHGVPVLIALCVSYCRFSRLSTFVRI